nr:SPOR domain-containing protein [Paracoccus sp. (in: a-proteobacteria)]
MTLLDFRSGGHQGARGSFARNHHDDAIDDWHPDDDWAAGRTARQTASERLTDQDSLLGRAARLTHYLGALVSVTLMISLGIWGYQLVVRDVSGVPVIRAVEGEARIVPDEPGGKLSDRTGLAVNEIAGGAEPSAADKVAIAPAPTALDGQDVAMGALGATARQSAVIEEPVPAPTEAAIALSDAEAAARTAEAQEAARASGVPAVAPGETD